MDIGKIESDLNNFEADSDKVIWQILNITVQNQAMLRTILDCQINLLKFVAPNLSVDVMEKQMFDAMKVYEAQLQAILSSRY